jgi:hypothetical protein
VLSWIPESKPSNRTSRLVYTSAAMDTRTRAFKQDFTVSVHWCCHGHLNLRGQTGLHGQCTPVPESGQSKRDGNLSPVMGARNQEGIGLSYRPASLCSLATQFQTRFLESIPRPMAGLKFSTQDFTVSVHCCCYGHQNLSGQTGLHGLCTLVMPWITEPRRSNRTS